MRGLRFAVAGLLAAGLVTIAQAQFRPGGGGGGPTSLVNAKSVQEELKLSEETVTKLREWSKEFQKTAAEIRKDKGVEGGGFGGKGGKGGKAPSAEQLEKIAAANKEISAVAYKQLGEVLTKEQVERIKQIELQQLGIRAFTSAAVVEGLKLTDSQKTSITGISGDFSKESREISTAAFGGADGGKGKFDVEKFRESQTKVQKLEKEYISKIVDVLEDAQKTTWKEMIGAPFDVASLRQGFGGGRPTTPKKD